MKRLFAIAVLLLVLVPCLHADGPDDQYVRIYNLIQEGDSLGTSQTAQALAKYTEAQTALQKFQRIYPSWNERVVSFRLNYLASKITILSAGAAGVQKLPPPTVPKTQPPAQAAVPRPQAPAQSQPVVQPQPVVQTQVVVQAPAVVQFPTPQSNSSFTFIPSQPQAPPQQLLPPPQPAPQPQPQILNGGDFQNQITELQTQLAQLQGEKASLQAKLREALAARPAGVDPREWQQAQEQIRSIQKENDLLQVSLVQEREKAASLTNSAELEKTRGELADTKRQLAEQTNRVSQLTQENESLQAQVKTLAAVNSEVAALRSENAALKKLADAKSPGDTTAAMSVLRQQLAQAQATITSLEADKDVWRLEKMALQNRVKQLSVPPGGAITPVWAQDSEHVKQLERERNDLQKKLDAAQKELYGRNGKATAARVDELANQLETLRARLVVYEAKPVPFTPEELALFKKPEAAVTDPNAGKKSVRELPAGTVELVSEAQKDFSERSYAQAEQKYLEVLKRDDKNVNTLGNLAAIQLEMGHFDDAEKNLKTALNVTPDDAYCLSLLGNLKFREEKYDDALDALSSAAKADPKNAEVQNFLGLALSEKGMRGAAETAFRKAVILNPNYGGAQNNLAVFYLTQKPPSVELARWHYDKAIAAGFPHNLEMEKLLDEKKTADSGQ